jgi:L-asparaginase
MSKKIVFLGTGGTIAGKAQSSSDNVAYTAAQVPVTDLLQAVPALLGVLGERTMVAEQVAQVDSKDMDRATWVALAQRACLYLAQADVTGIVVTHGTDTIEETAFFLHSVLPNALQSAKPVVLTCAMRPFTSQSPDGPQNLLDATALACLEGAHGVMVVCAGAIHSAQQVQKIHPYRLDPFDSGESGPLGYVEEGRVRMIALYPEAQSSDVTMALLSQGTWPRVEIVTSHAGAGRGLIDSLCRLEPRALDPLRGLVIAGTGNGTIHRDMAVALDEVRASGVHVLRASRCPYGKIVEGPPADVSALPSTGLSPVKARISLMLDLLSQQ